MKSKIYGTSFSITAPGFLHPTGYLFPWFQPRPRNSRQAGTPESKSPYPGIHIGSASELLDFRFKETEIL
jgi:hypothetical protein